MMGGLYMGRLNYLLGLLNNNPLEKEKKISQQVYIRIKSTRWDYQILKKKHAV